MKLFFVLLWCFLVANCQLGVMGHESALERSKKRREETPGNVQPVLKGSKQFDISAVSHPKECETKAVPKGCTEATACSHRSGIYNILLEEYSSKPFLVECEVETEGGKWTVIQRRQDGSVDFFRSWAEYKRGFGKIGGEFFIGLDKLHALTSHYGPHELLIILKIDNETVQAKYDDFAIGNESEGYVLKKLGVYSGTAGDALSPNVGKKFSTKDHYYHDSHHVHNNDAHYDDDYRVEYEENLAVAFEGAWWFNDMNMSHLNGKYGDTTLGKGILWYTSNGFDVSISKVTMMIRRRTL